MHHVFDLFFTAFLLPDRAMRVDYIIGPAVKTLALWPRCICPKVLMCLGLG